MKFLITATVFLIIYSGVSLIGTKVAMEIPRVPLAVSPEAYSLAYRNVSFMSRGEGPVLLKGWLLPGANSRVVVFLNGGFRNRVDTTIDTLSLARDLVQRGYSVLLFDFRSRGKSEGWSRTLSFTHEDVGGAVDFLKGQGFAPESIALLGFSSGTAGHRLRR